MEFMHMFNQGTTGHVRRHGFGIIPTMWPELRDRWPAAAHEDWRQWDDDGCGYYAVSSAEEDPWADGDPFGFANVPGGTRGTLYGRPGPERNYSHSPQNPGGRDGESVMPEVFGGSLPGATTPAAYSVEEPGTPLLTDPFSPSRLLPIPPPNLRHHHQHHHHRSPPEERNRRRRSSRRRSAHDPRNHNTSTFFQTRFPSAPFDETYHLPSRTQRCETLPSSASSSSSTTPLTPPRHPSSSPPLSPRARSPTSFTQHVYPNTSNQKHGEDHRHHYHRSPTHSPSPHQYHHQYQHHSPNAPSPHRHHQHMLLSAHQRTRRHLRALERELQRLSTHNHHHGPDDNDHVSSGRNHRAARARGSGPGEAWGGAWRPDDGLGRREEWDVWGRGPHFRRGGGSSGSW